MSPARDHVLAIPARLTAGLGWPVEHSASPRMLNAAFAAANLDVVLVPMGVAPENLAAAVPKLHPVRVGIKILQ